MLRPTHSIRRRQATNTNPAIKAAERLGHPLNYFVTINFGSDQEVVETVSKDFAHIRALFVKWCRRPKRNSGKPAITPTFYWVAENTGHIAVHWVVHIPTSRFKDFQERLPIWASRVLRRELMIDAIDVKPVRNNRGLRKYLLKGIDPTYAPLYRITHVPQGLIYGKRMGFSKNLRPSECQRLGTKPRFRWDCFADFTTSEWVH